MRLYALKWYDEKNLITGIDGAILAFTSKAAARKFARESLPRDDSPTILRERNWTRYATVIAFKVDKLS